MTNLEEAFERAGEIAKKLPPALQQTAFNRALDALLATHSRPTKLAQPGRKLSGSASRPPTDPEFSLVNEIDRTKYTDISATNRVADRALKVLQLAREDYNVEELSAAQIAQILVQKFRLSTTVPAVRMALDRESGTVNVRSLPDGSNVYTIMAPGDAYLEQLRAGKTATPAPIRRPRASRKSTRRGTEPADAAADRSSKPQKRTKSLGRPGPKVAVQDLVESGFFSSPRGISEIRQNLKDTKGNTYSLTDLSPALVRCMRDGALTRKRNQAGQYEYSKA